MALDSIREVRIGDQLRVVGWGMEPIGSVGDVVKIETTGYGDFIYLKIVGYARNRPVPYGPADLEFVHDV